MPLRPRFIGGHETMTTSKLKGACAAAAFVVGTLACKTAGAGGISVHEVGTADIGLWPAPISDTNSRVMIWQCLTVPRFLDRVSG
jgi:hypothetical protein